MLYDNATILMPEYLTITILKTSKLRHYDDNFGRISQSPVWSAISAKNRTRYISRTFSRLKRAFIFIKGNFNNLRLHLTKIPIAYGFQLLLNLTYFRISTTSDFQQL